MISVPNDRPLLLDNPRVWRTYVGGANLETLHGRAPQNSQFPEEWIMSVVEAHNAGRENIVEGLSRLPDYDNAALREIIAKDPSGYLGKDHAARYGTELGVLVKLIDTVERLTVQVHPDKQTAKRLFQSDYGKTECWHILGGQTIDDEEPCVYLGFKPGITRDAWKRLFEKQDIPGMLSCMHKIPVKPGDTVFIAGGMPHAIGAGCLLVEIQEPTDYTIRIERVTPKGLQIADSLCHQGLGFEKMFDCFHYEGMSCEEVVNRYFIPSEILDESPNGRRNLLIGGAHTDLFRLEEILVEDTLTVNHCAVFCGLYVLEGSGELLTAGHSQHLEKAQQYFLPAGVGDFSLKKTGDALRVFCFFGPRTEESIR